MKKIITIALSIILIFAINITAFAINNTNVTKGSYENAEDEVDTNNSNLVEITINLNIEEAFKYFDSGKLLLQNKETLDTNSYPISQLFTKDNATILIDRGNYKFIGFIFSTKYGTAQNYKATMTPSEFSVNDAGVVEDTPTLNIYQEITLPQEQVNQTLINDGDFNGYVGVSYYTITDALNVKDTYIDEETGEEKKNPLRVVTHSFTRMGEINNTLYAGKSRITNVYAYDSNKQPLNVYVSPYFFVTQRTPDPSSLSGEPQKIYAFHNESELSEEQLATIKNEEYMLIAASSMDDFANFPENTLMLSPSGESGVATIYANDIPAFEKGWDLHTTGPSGKEVKLRYGYSGDKEITEIETPKEKNYFWVVFVIVGILAIVLLIYLKKKNNKREKEENDEENDENGKTVEETIDDES